ncbi:MAG: AAA family ATPase [Candidatus Parcubacteria bacterium]|nr:AAA family ATPase [Candidatus Parcubacteria bacterium]
MNGEKTILRQFFQNFLAQEKKKEDISEEYLSFLKILWSGFDDIISRNKNQRKVYIIEQIERFLNDDKFKQKVNTIELPEHNEVALLEGIGTPRIKLNNIQLVNFRGFQANKDGKGRLIEFNEKATLIFAPNGGGKTSLCEALEWTLTGDSSEREERKADPVGMYFQNNYQESPKYNTTKLSINGDSTLIPSQIFDRCFLEKNRIEKFAKLAIQPSAEIQEVLGELFGFSDIVNFFKEFGQDISPTDKEKNQPERENWRIWLNWNTKKIDLEKSIEEAKKEEVDAINELNKLIGDKSYEDKKNEIEESGKKLKEELNALGKDFSITFSAKDFVEKVKSFLNKIAEWKKLNKNINENAQKLDFENLFQSANIIFKSYKDNKCPLCDTPFDQSGGIFKRSGVVIDPRKKTSSELKKLKQLSDWKNEIAKLEGDLKGFSFRSIRDDWQKIQLNLLDDNWQGIAGNKEEKIILPVIDFNTLELKIDNKISSYLDECEKIFSNDFSALSNLEKIILDYQKNKQEVLKLKPEKELKINKLREELRKLLDQNNNLTIKQKIRKDNEIKLQKILEQTNNAKSFVNLINIYSSDFYLSIQLFQSSSLLKEGVDIDEYLTGFYKALNLYDQDKEKVKEIHFPKSTQDQFCVVYLDDENKNCNALHRLSEGHLKTLGLAALLARAIKYSSPILIFDDAINAIDSDHRDNIAFLLSNNFSNENGIEAFGDKWDKVKNYLNECQFIITSHDRFFDEKIANLFNKENQKRYVLYSGKNGVDFCEKGNPANFEGKIEYFLRPEIQDIRSAIFYCRIWLEELLLNIAINFRKPTNNKQIEFENIIDKKTRQLKNPELITIIDRLISNLNKPDTQPDQKKIANLLEEIGKEKEGKYIWLFEILNQESHYRRFDHVNISNAPTSKEVENIFNIIQKIESLSNIIK